MSIEASTTTPESAAERWVAGFTEGWRAPNSPDAFAEHFRGLLAPDIRLIQPQLPTLVGYRSFEERFVAPVFALIPDLHGDVERWASSGETLYIELTLSGTLGGRPVSWRACDRITLREGVAVERESYFDPTPLITAIVTRPRAWLRYLALRARLFAAATTRRSRG